MSVDSTAVQKTLEAIVNELLGQKHYYQSFNLTDSSTYESLKSTTKDFRKELLRLSIEKARKAWQKKDYQDKDFRVGEKLIATLMRSDLGFSANELMEMALLAATGSPKTLYYWFPTSIMVSQLEKLVKKEVFTDSLKSFLAELANPKSGYYDGEKTALRVKELIVRESGTNGEIVPVLLSDTDLFGQLVNRFTQSLDKLGQAAWYPLLGAFRKASGGKPTQKYLRETEALVAVIGKEAFLNQMKNWFGFLKSYNPTIEEKTHTYTIGHGANAQERSYTYTTHTYISDNNLLVIKGLMWALQPLADTETLAFLANFAEKCYRKIPGKGPLAAGVGNACLYTLAQSGLAGVSHLSRLRLRIRQASTQDLIEGYIREAAAKLNITPAEIEDMATPAFGLVDGTLETDFDGYRAVLRIDNAGKPELRWFKPDGSPLKSEPSVVKQQHTDEVKELKASVQQIQKTLSAQRDRMDRSLIEDRTWTYENFQTYYFGHGLMSHLAKRLIWTFETGGKSESAIWLNDAWRNIREEPITEPTESTVVRLWHPIYATTDEVLVWRELLAKHNIRQPLKQAYREVYLLTDAEVNTRIYSNRMAAHILKQHQFNSLAKIRGWRYSLLGAYDKGYDSDTATVELPQGWRAEFWVQEVYADGEWNDTGTYNYVSTDQIRFYRNNDQQPLLGVPPLILSETLRDVDLFVGVASVGNDPNWRDGGLQQYRTYWEHYSFGDLTEVAKTRKQVLERLVPRLKIAKQCEIRDKFLVVRGQLRTYKIHIGSGNILMEPNDQYLCIVPDRRSDTSSNQVFLPFEGDAVLSIVLSKAFLLANDTAITDPTIISQLKR